MKNIYTYVAKDGYAARVQDTKSYDAIRFVDYPVPRPSGLMYPTFSKDILSRWTFPLVPDNNHPSSHAYEHRRGNKYFPRDNTVILSRYVELRVIALSFVHRSQDVYGRHKYIDWFTFPDI
jgi:translation initiation factor eIF-2B subunit epsilon